MQHFLQLYGTDLLETLQNCDHTIDTALNPIATGITDFGRKQEALGVRVGVGLRQLRHLAIPAELAATIRARPTVVELSQALTRAGLIDGDLITKHLDGKIAQATRFHRRTRPTREPGTSPLATWHCCTSATRIGCNAPWNPRRNTPTHCTLAQTFLTRPRVEPY